MSNATSQHKYSVTGSVWGLPLLVLCLLQVMVVLDGTVVNLALARIQVELALSDNLRSWVVTSYALAFGGLLLLGGRLGDVFGRKRAFLGGVAMFTAASLACGLAASPALLLAARVIQGIGAAVASPTAMALIVATFAPGKPRNQAFAAFAAMSGLGSVLGLVVGGALTEASWRWIFLINVPIGLVILICGWFALTNPQSGETMSLDVRGAILATSASTLLVYGMTAGGGGLGWIGTATIIAGAVLLIAFFLSQRTAENPVLPLSMFSNPSRAAAFVCLLLGGAMMMAMTVQVALFVQEVMEFRPMQAGLSFIPFAVAFALGTVIASKLAETIAPRPIIVVAALVLAAGFVYATTLDADVTYMSGMFAVVVIVGVSIGMLIIPLTLSVVAGVKPRDVGPLTATSLVCQTLGGPLGLAAVTAFAEYRTRSHLGDAFDTLNREALTKAEQIALADGYTSSLMICAVLSAAVAVTAAIYIKFTPEEIAEGKAAEAAANME